MSVSGSRVVVGATQVQHRRLRFDHIAPLQHGHRMDHSSLPTTGLSEMVSGVVVCQGEARKDTIPFAINRVLICRLGLTKTFCLEVSKQ